MDNKLSGIRNAMLTNVGTTLQYPEYSRNLLQTKFEEEFGLSADYYVIEEETSFGALTYKSLGVRFKSAMKTSTGTKLGQDFKKIIFKDVEHPTSLGARFKFEDNIWITVNIDPYNKTTLTSMLRRCNNTINLLTDNVAKTIHKEPCIVEYTYSRNVMDYDEAITLPDGVIAITVQSNSITRSIGINKRIMFGGQVFKVSSVENFSKLKTFSTGNSALITFKAEKDQLQSYDNASLNVANYYDNQDFPETPVINSAIEQQIITQEEQEQVFTSGFVITPKFSQVREEQKQVFQVEYYVNGISQNHSFSTQGLNLKGYYSLIQLDSRTFELTCLHRSLTLLEIKITNNNNLDTTILNIELKGMF